MRYRHTIENYPRLVQRPMRAQHQTNRTKIRYDWGKMEILNIEKVRFFQIQSSHFRWISSMFEWWLESIKNLNSLNIWEINICIVYLLKMEYGWHFWLKVSFNTTKYFFEIPPFYYWIWNLGQKSSHLWSKSVGLKKALCMEEFQKHFF